MLEIINNLVDLIFGEMFSEDVGHIELVFEFVDHYLLCSYLVLKPEFVHSNVTDFAKSAPRGNCLASCGISMESDVQSYAKISQQTLEPKR